jgi:hypothetical protein
MPKETKYSLDEVLDAVKGTGAFAGDDGMPKSSSGNISYIARRLGVERQTVYNYIDKWVTVERAVKDEREAMLDYTENQLLNQVREGNITAIIFTLKTLGKSRGYVERSELAGVEDNPVSVMVYIPDNKRD